MVLKVITLIADAVTTLWQQHHCHAVVAKALPCFCDLDANPNAVTMPNDPVGLIDALYLLRFVEPESFLFRLCVIL